MTRGVLGLVPDDGADVVAAAGVRDVRLREVQWSAVTSPVRYAGQASAPTRPPTPPFTCRPVKRPDQRGFNVFGAVVEGSVGRTGAGVERVIDAYAAQLRHSA